MVKDICGKFADELLETAVCIILCNLLQLEQLESSQWINTLNIKYQLDERFWYVIGFFFVYSEFIQKCEIVTIFFFPFIVVEIKFMWVPPLWFYKNVKISLYLDI